MQRGLSHFYRINKTDHAEAIRLFREAIALDPEFATAHAHLAYALWTVKVTIGDDEDTANDVASGRAAAEQAVSLDPNEPVAHYALGRAHIFAGEIEMAIGEMQNAIAINPNSAQGHHGLGLTYYWGAGQAEQALPHFDAALRLSPRDPLRWMTLTIKGSALRFLGRYDEAIAICRQACQVPDTGYLPHMHLATALAEAGQKSEAKAAIEKAMQLQPLLSIRFLHDRFVGKMHETDRKSLLDSLRKAGLPEQTAAMADEPAIASRPGRIVKATDDAVDAPSLSDRPSIAVLPFENMSGDAEQDYFADGVAEDIITALSRFRFLFVIARNSSFTYKGRNVDVRQVGLELGARYVIEGSVRKGGERVRVTAQLIDAETGHHVWAEKYDRELQDIFAVQDELTQKIAGIVAPTLEDTEHRRSMAKAPTNLNAWDCYLRGMACLNEYTGPHTNVCTVWGKGRSPRQW